MLASPSGFLASLAVKPAAGSLAFTPCTTSAGGAGLPGVWALVLQCPLQAAVTRCEGWGWGCGVEASMFLDLPAGDNGLVGQGS